MRWDNLFDDLEGQLEQELTAEEIDLHAEEERLRLARLGVRDRLMAMSGVAHSGQPAGQPAGQASEQASEQSRGQTPGQTTGRPSARALRLSLTDGTRIAVSPSTFGRDWFAGQLRDDTQRTVSCIVPIDAIAGITLAHDQVVESLGDPRAEQSPGALSARLGLTFVLRDLCRRRQSLDLWLLSGNVHGTLDRVGRDHFDLAVHEPGSVRRESAVIEHRIVRLSQLLLVRL